MTYLARFLLNYDKASRELWDEMATTIPINFRCVCVVASSILTPLYAGTFFEVKFLP